MFNVSKKTLSVVLCLALLLSVVAVCFMTPATAETITSTQTFCTYGNIPSNSKYIEYTFDGSYGVPFARATNIISYKDGCMTATNSGGWWFFGNEAAKSISTVKVADQSAANDAFVAENLLQVEAGKTYRIVFNYKIAEGSIVVTGQKISLGLAANPNQQMDSSGGDAFTFIEDNLKYEWTIGGAEQANGTNLSADSDWHTASAVITPNATAFLGVQNYFGNGTTYSNNKVVYDSITIYQFTSETFEKLTFDKGGLGVHRYLTGTSIAKDENGNGYCVIDDSTGTTGSAYFANNPYSSKYTVSSSSDYKDEAKLKKINAAYSNMFNFKSTKTYEVTFKYRYASTKDKYADTPMVLRLMADPAGVALNNDELTGANAPISWAKDITYTGLYSPNKLGLNNWQQLKVVFTVKTAAENSTIIRADANQPSDSDVYNLTIEDTGAYFGIRCIGQVVHIDDFDIKLVEKRDSVSVTTDYVYHDMEDEDYVVDAKPSDFTMASGDATIVDLGGEHGKVLNITGNRGRFSDSKVFEAGKKYYISFDAKTTDGTSKNMWLILADATSKSAPRFIVSDNNGNQTARFAGIGDMFKYYINGKQVADIKNFKLSGEWQNFGIVIDLTNETYNYNLIHSTDGLDTKDAATLLNAARYFYCGIANSYYDNFSIVSTSDVAGAVPESTGDELNYISKVYENSMDTNNVTSYSGSTSVVEVDGRKVIKMSSNGSRFAVNDTNFITKGHKYTISFDARLDVEDDTTEGIYMILSKTTSSGSLPRFFINTPAANGGAGGSSNDALVSAAFKFYEQDLTTDEIIEISSPRDLKINKTWKKYIIEFDYTNETFVSTIEAATSGDYYHKVNGKLTEFASYFNLGNAGGLFDNLEIVEYAQGEPDVEVSIRKPSGTGDDYASAGLRFKTAVDNSVVKNAAEIGFVVAPSTNAARTDGWWELENGLNPIARKGVVKVGVNQDGWYYAKDTSHTYYQMVITGLSTESGNTAYNRRFSAVLYVKNTDGSYDYYALGEASYYQVLGITETLKAPKIKEAE